ncbi:ABC transporter substrate-binding protein [Aquiluna sp. Uisw_065]|uniref:ABC transporter substrate-binding protein n=1 Tax=Aquiluna sp. Uisw_065 TaxID=3230967 RepID=UPI0039E83DAC
MKSIFTVKKPIAVLATVLFLATLAGCSGASTETSSSTAAPQPSELEGQDLAGTTIRVTLANHVWTESIKELIPQFEEETGATVEISQLAEDQLSDQYNVKLNAGTDEIDVLMYRPLQENKLFASNGYLADITDLATSDTDWDWADFQPGPAALTSYEGAVVGVPIITERTVLYYRKDLLEAVGLEVPTTLQELDAAAAAIHAANPDVSGYVGRTGKSAAVTQFNAFLHSYGGTWIAEDGTSAIGSDEARAAYAYYGNLIRNHTNATINPEMSWPEAFAIFQQGQAAFLADADSLYKNMTDPEKSTVSDSVGFAPFPAGPAGSKPYNVAAWALSINQDTTNLAGAWAFVKWATSKEISLELAKLGVSGARTSVWANPEATADYPAELVTAIQLNGANGVGLDRPLVFEVARAREIVGEPIVIAISGGDLDAAIDDANQTFDDFLLTDTK